MVNVGILYAITAGVSSITIYVIINRILATEHKELINTKLVNLMRFFTVFCLVDMIWGLLTSRLFINNQILYTIFTYAFHLGAALSAFLWAGYVIHYLKLDTKYRRVLSGCLGTVFLIQVSVLVSNLWTKSFFYVDKEANYHSYELRNFMFLMQFLYYIALILFSIIKIFISRKDKEMKPRYRTALLYSCVPLAFGVGQMLWPDASMYSLGFMFTTVLIYSINISSEREGHLKTIFQNENNKLQEVVLGLANDYQAIYYVDLETNEYEVFGQSNTYVNEVGNRISNNNHFFADIVSNVSKVVAKEDRRDVLRMLCREYILNELATKNSYSFNYRVIYENSIRYYLCRVIGVTKDNGEYKKVVIGVFDDDERMKKEAEQKKILEEALTSAENANKAKTNFLFSMSHDIRTPMNSIIGFTNLAQKHIDDKDFVSDCLSKVSMSSDHLLLLINDVLDMARIESGKMNISLTPESITEKYSQLVPIFEELAVAKSISFNPQLINVEKDWILCDSLHMNQVILNILSNAVKYTNPGGSVDFSIEEADLGENKVSLTFIVKDTGIGMSKEFVSKIYDEFERENSATTSGVQGTGLGMSIVKRLIDMMGGTIDVDSTQGVGTTVTVKVSFDVTDPVERATDSVDVENIPSGRRLLLVDDNPLNREIAIDLISELGVECDTATDGEEAVEKVSNNEAGYYDLVLMDVQMPKMNGYEATKKIRSLEDSVRANIPIVAMTANAFDEDKKDAFDAGMNAHLSKPIDISALSKTLKKFL